MFFCSSKEMHSLLLKQQLNRLKDYLASAEKQMNKYGPIGPDYNAVQEQISEHQVIIATFCSPDGNESDGDC